MLFPFKVFFSPVFMLVFLICMGMLLAKRRPGLAKTCTIAGLLLLWTATTKPVVDLIAAPLEFAYAKYAGQPISHIWVLGCNHSDSEFLPDYNRLEPCSQTRMLEAVRIWQQNPSATLHLSGTIKHRQQQHTAVALDFAHQLGVPLAQIQLHPQAFNTQQEAELVVPVLLSTTVGAQGSQVALVTSAMHMTRAMRWAQAYGLTPIAAPTDFTIRRKFAEHKPEGWVPNERALLGFSYAQYEYLGLIAQWFILQS